MEYLNIKRSKTQLRADGSRYAKLIFITKTEKYGKPISEKTISVKKPVLLTGEPDSGKSRWIKRLHEHAMEIWGTKSRSEPLLLEARAPLPSWGNTPAVRAWWKQQQQNLPAEQRKPWSALKQEQRSAVLPAYCAATGAVLFIDDAHKLLGGHQLKLAEQCLRAARIWVVAAYKEARLPAELHQQINQGEPQRFNLRFRNEIPD